MRACLRDAIARCCVTAGTAFAAAGDSVAAEPAKVPETMPANGARIDRVAADYYARFNQSVDHIHSVLLIRQNGSVEQTRLSPSQRFHALDEGNQQGRRPAEHQHAERRFDCAHHAVG